MSLLRPLIVFGTRPEAVKMGPIVRGCRRRAAEVQPVVCLTGQHRELAAGVIEYFEIAPDVDLQVMTPDQTLAGLTSRCVEGVDRVIEQFQPDCMVVQGDTTTALAAALAAFYRRLPLIHVEAGLRTGDLLAPWPEELNRRIVGLTAAVHCAPTQTAADALIAEGVSQESVHVTGNTAVDALLWTVAREKDNHRHWQQKHAALGGRQMILVTGHRRESFGRRLENICRAIGRLAERFADCQFVYPVHLNPEVQGPVSRLLAGRANVRLMPPATYPEFVWLMQRSTLILTDSGGVQEEAPSLGKPVLVMRETTERPEAVEAGAARLLGTSAERIVDGVARLLTDPAEYARCQVAENPFGDGRAAERIVDLMLMRPWGK